MCGIVVALPGYRFESEDVSDRHLLEAVPEPPAIATVRGEPARGEMTNALEGVIKNLAAAVELYALPHAGHRMALDGELRGQILARLDGLDAWFDALDRELDQADAIREADLLEDAQRRVVRGRDLTWTLREEWVGGAARVASLCNGVLPDPVVATSYLAVDAVLSALDRLEVRGRDSAGVQLWVRLSDDDLASLPASLRERQDNEYRHRAVTFFRGGVSVVYKRASVIGRLGDNVDFLRRAITADADLHTVVALPSARVTVLAHTRWASVGRISENNAHPVDSVSPVSGATYATAVLNGDIDNHVELRERLGMAVDMAGITTDAKLIPVTLAQRIDAGSNAVEAFAAAIGTYHGSFAIAAQTDADPDQVLLAVKGSGQGLYVGLARGCFLVASEVYGLVGLTDQYIRIDGTAGAPGAAGTVVALHAADAGGLAALRRYTVAVEPDPVRDDEISTAEITTRDVARGGFDHYLVKEISEAPASFRKSLRGRIAGTGDRLTVVLSEANLPRSLREKMASGEIREFLFIGQGTAAVACRGISNVVRQLLPPAVSVDALPASELSAWGLQRDMSHVCLVAVSQSGSTTDTNRAVDMARTRGAAVLAIVNRRDSDLAHKSDGVLYTSDGRDVEMAVASTKAFYSQVATGALLGLQIARVFDHLPADRENSLLQALLEMPQNLEALQELTPQLLQIAEAAVRYPYWTVVGSGPNRVAAEEIRIKMSELCYKTISTDAVEDKKHVDLSAEAFVFVCAAGAPAGQLRDLAKEVDIFAAHRNEPVVIVDEGVDLPWATDRVVQVRASHPMLAWILSTATGHLLAYHIARAIDAKAEPLREALSALETSVDAGRVTIDDLDRACNNLHEFVADAAQGCVRGVLGSDTAIRLSFASARLQHGATALTTAATEAANPVDFLRQQLTTAIDELTRSIDSVKHQAKTVTVGTSRGDADLTDNPLTAALAEVGGSPELVNYATLLAVRAFGRVVSTVQGATRYQVGWSADHTSLRVSAKTGVAAELTSRADNGTELRGSKRLAVQSRAVRLVRGAHDGRLVLMIPEQTGARVHALTLVHVLLHETTDADHLIEILESTGNRLEEIRGAVTETDTHFDPAALASLPVETILLAPVSEIAGVLTAPSAGRS